MSFSNRCSFLYKFYPRALITWDDVMIVDYGIHKFQVVYLGWNEYRCGDNDTCSLQNTCCGCELDSFVHGTPVCLIDQRTVVASEDSRSTYMQAW